MMRGSRLLLAALLLAAAPAFADSWNVEVLPHEAAWSVTSIGSVNEAGDAVGRYGLTGFLDPHALLWESGSGTYTDIAAEVGGLPAGYVHSFALGINNNGIVGGTVADGPLNTATQAAILWDVNAKTWQLVHPGLAGFDSSRIAAVNDLGFAVGDVINLGAPFPNPQRAYLWTPGGTDDRLLPIDPAFDGSNASELNNSGFVAGWFNDTATFASNAVLWAPDDSFTDIHPKLVAANPDIFWSRAFGISESGLVSGTSWDATFTTGRPWTWDPATDTLTLLDKGGAVGAIGSQNQGSFMAGAVGPFNDAFPAVWVDGELNVLDRLPQFTSMFAFVVNSGGVVAGDGNSPDGNRAWIGTPIPEPGLFALCLLGLGAAWMRRPRAQMSR
jgi:hypothetical protein